jgi:hypothetical protein
MTTRVVMAHGTSGIQLRVQSNSRVVETAKKTIRKAGTSPYTYTAGHLLRKN